MKTSKSKIKRPTASRFPKQWSEAELSKQSLVSIAAFRQERLAEGRGEWDAHVKAARAKFTALFRQVSALAPGGITNSSLLPEVRVALASVILGFEHLHNL